MDITVRVRRKEQSKRKASCLLCFYYICAGRQVYQIGGKETEPTLRNYFSEIMMTLGICFCSTVPQYFANVTICGFVMCVPNIFFYLRT
jgi:hypothetical protein